MDKQIADRMRLKKANDQQKMPTQRCTVKISAGIAIRSKAGKVELLNDDERKALKAESTAQPNDSINSCKSKSEIEESRVSADGSSADAGVQAETYQGLTAGIAIHE